MPHWRSMQDSDWLRAYDLQGKDYTVTIDKVVAGEVTGEKGKKSKKPVAFFRGAKKPLALNSTNCKTVARMYGTDTDQWVGKQITLFVSTTQKDGEELECIRIRPAIPRGKEQGDGQTAS